jgi:hypothetical protein
MSGIRNSISIVPLLSLFCTELIHLVFKFHPILRGQDPRVLIRFRDPEILMLEAPFYDPELPDPIHSLIQIKPGDHFFAFLILEDPFDQYINFFGLIRLKAACVDIASKGPFAGVLGIP